MPSFYFLSFYNSVVDPDPNGFHTFWFGQFYCKANVPDSSTVIEILYIQNR
jgi:hypothetical protein